jgi:hypothetical protein
MRDALAENQGKQTYLHMHWQTGDCQNRVMDRISSDWVGGAWCVSVPKGMWWHVVVQCCLRLQVVRHPGPHGIQWGILPTYVNKRVLDQ